MKIHNFNSTNNYDPANGELVNPGTRKKIRRTVIIVHVAVVLVPFIGLMIYKWFKPNPPERIQVRLVQQQVGVNQRVNQPALPKKHILKKLTHKRKPVIKKPTHKRKPVIKKPTHKRKPVIKKPTHKRKPVIKKPTHKRKQTLLSAKDIIISKNFIKHKTKPRRRLSPDDLEKKILKKWQKVKSSTTTTRHSNSQLTAAYATTVGAYLKPIWNQPDKISLAGRTPEVTIKLDIDRAGRVTGARIIRKSGVAVMDNSVTALLKNLKNVPPPPDNRPQSITIIMAVEI